MARCYGCARGRRTRALMEEDDGGTRFAQMQLLFSSGGGASRCRSGCSGDGDGAKEEDGGHGGAVAWLRTKMVGKKASMVADGDGGGGCRGGWKGN